MDALFSALPHGVLPAAIAVTVFAAFVKGAIGFAMPMIMISGLASLMPAETALAALIVPTLLANLWQALRGGLGPALAVVGAYRIYLAVLLGTIALSAQLVTVLPRGAMYLVLGGPIIGFALLQLAGWTPSIPAERRWRADLIIGMTAGVSGGMAGVWGPPTVLYLAAMNTPKRDAIRVQGVVYLAGAVVLLAAHLRSGVLNTATVPLSLLLVVPMGLGMWLGQRVQDRLDQQKFRRAMLVVLVIAGANLLRRGLILLG
ncbi:MAG: sulfite exporter TauE/SafE family protein [Rhodobacteraceae bacterium]|nr:sulfite exporter TauE/SafE family protein [Paracoccaceae bacterium]